MTGFEVKPPYMCSYEGCESPKATGMDMCHSHLAGLRKLSRDLKKQKEKRYVPISKMSQKRAGENAQYSVARNVWLMGRMCEACGDPATEIHHKAGRTNDLLLEKKYWMAVCRPCHNLITEDSAWAIREGYSIKRNQNH